MGGVEEGPGGHDRRKARGNPPGGVGLGPLGFFGRRPDAGRGTREHPFLRGAGRLPLGGPRPAGGEKTVQEDGRRTIPNPFSSKVVIQPPPELGFPLSLKPFFPQKNFFLLILFPFFLRSVPSTSRHPKSGHRGQDPPQRSGGKLPGSRRPEPRGPRPPDPRGNPPGGPGAEEAQGGRRSPPRKPAKRPLSCNLATNFSGGSDGSGTRALPGPPDQTPGASRAKDPSGAGQNASPTSHLPPLRAEPILGPWSAKPGV